MWSTRVDKWILYNIIMCRAGTEDDEWYTRARGSLWTGREYCKDEEMDVTE